MKFKLQTFHAVSHQGIELGIQFSSIGFPKMAKHVKITSSKFVTKRQCELLVKALRGKKRTTLLPDKGCFATVSQKSDLWDPTPEKISKLLAGFKEAGL